MKTYNLILCEGRHKIDKYHQVDGSIFPNRINDPDDISYIKKLADKKLRQILINKNEQYVINIYNTGLTICLIELLKLCKKYDNIKVNVLHWSKTKNDYIKQGVF